MRGRWEEEGKEKENRQKQERGKERGKGGRKEIVYLFTNNNNKTHNPQVTVKFDSTLSNLDYKYLFSRQWPVREQVLVINKPYTLEHSIVWISKLRSHILGSFLCCEDA